MDRSKKSSSITFKRALFVGFFTSTVTAAGFFTQVSPLKILNHTILSPIKIETGWISKIGSTSWKTQKIQHEFLKNNNQSQFKVRQFSYQTSKSFLIDPQFATAYQKSPKENSIDKLKVVQAKAQIKIEKNIMFGVFKRLRHQFIVATHKVNDSKLNTQIARRKKVKEKQVFLQKQIAQTNNKSVKIHRIKNTEQKLKKKRIAIQEIADSVNNTIHQAKQKTLEKKQITLPPIKWVEYPEDPAPIKHLVGSKVNTQNDYSVAKNDHSVDHLVVKQSQPARTKTKNPGFQSHLSSHNGYSNMTTQNDYSNLNLLSKQGSAHQFVEIFSGKKYSKDQVRIKVVSFEGKQDSKGPRWETFDSRSFHKTLALVNPRKRKVEVLSLNAIKMLNQIHSQPVLSQMGWVYGRLPAGWMVSLNGRSGEVIYLGEDERILSLKEAMNSKTPVTFVYINVAPGARLLALSNHLLKKTAKVALPVLSKVATYLDLRKVNHNTVVGQVLDAMSTRLDGLDGIQVKIVGQPQSTVFSNMIGHFEIENVLSFGHYPYFVETDHSDGYTHRYRFSPKQTQVQLFRFPVEAIDDWIFQVPKGLSPQSGLVVGAFPGLKNYGKEFYPEVKTLESRATLRPQIFSLSHSGELFLESSLEKKHPRMLGVQVPEGWSLHRIRNQNGKTLWSELHVASRGVINIIGAY
ncbi:MAG: hypothetical protein CL678_06265 [Bdellovibrionaceae bacterium]|nr:hypothetical protein [Pseudobdellovibrionaceae bacterium]